MAIICFLLRFSLRVFSNNNIPGVLQLKIHNEDNCLEIVVFQIVNQIVICGSIVSNTSGKLCVYL